MKLRLLLLNSNFALSLGQPRQFFETISRNRIFKSFNTYDYILAVAFARKRTLESGNIFGLTIFDQSATEVALVGSVLLRSLT